MIMIITLTSHLSGPLIGPNGLIYLKSRTWCHSFQPIKEHFLCFVVFCLLFLSNVCIQHQVFHSIITQWYSDTNDTMIQIPNNFLDPQLIPKLSNILDANASDVMLKQKHKSSLWKTRNYYNDNYSNQCTWPSNLLVESQLLEHLLSGMASSCWISTSVLNQ